MNQKRNRVRSIAGSAIFAALSVVLYYVPRFPLPFFPSWLEVNFSMLPVIIATVAFGPLSGAVIVVLRCLLKLPASSTMYVGELADLVLGLAVVGTIALVLHLFRGKKETVGMSLSLLAGWLVWILVGIAANGLVLLPFYMKLFNMTPEIVVGALSMIPGVTSANYMTYYLLYAVAPFNALLGALVMLVTFGVWQGLRRSPAFAAAHEHEPKE